MELNSYFDFAEDDYRYFKKDYEDGRVANYLAAMAQNICERYMKYVIDEYAEPESEEEAAQKTKALRTHNLNKLISYIRLMGHELDRDMRIYVNAINGFYFTTRYPGDDSITVTAEDLEMCSEAISLCRSEMLRIEKQMQEKNQGNFSSTADR